MDIAALSIGLSNIQLQQSVGIALTKKVMDVSESQTNGLLRMMEPAATPPHPTAGKSIDFKG